MFIVAQVQIAFAEDSATSAIKVIENILNNPDKDIDLAKEKLTIDKLVDPNTDITVALAEIKKMVNTIKSGLNPDLKPLDKAFSLSAFLYEAGYWNNFKPFQYDLDDPLGQNLNSKLLSTYLKSKKGNCVSMPILYAILANKIGLDVTLSIAPLHVFVKLKNPATGQYINLETTDKGLPISNDAYKKDFSISNLAIKNKVYLQPLNKKKVVAVMAMLLNESFVPAKHLLVQKSRGVGVGNANPKR